MCRFGHGRRHVITINFKPDRIVLRKVKFWPPARTTRCMRKRTDTEDIERPIR